MYTFTPTEVLIPTSRPIVIIKSIYSPKSHVARPPTPPPPSLHSFSCKPMLRLIRQWLVQREEKSHQRVKSWMRIILFLFSVQTPTPSPTPTPTPTPTPSRLGVFTSVIASSWPMVVGPFVCIVILNHKIILCQLKSHLIRIFFYMCHFVGSLVCKGPILKW